MDMVPVSSSNLVAVGYDRSKRVLRVQFRTRTYDYFGVPESVYTNLLNSASKGRYLDRFIKPFYAFNRIH